MNLRRNRLASAWQGCMFHASPTVHFQDTKPRHCSSFRRRFFWIPWAISEEVVCRINVGHCQIEPSMAQIRYASVDINSNHAIYFCSRKYSRNMTLVSRRRHTGRPIEVFHQQFRSSLSVCDIAGFDQLSQGSQITAEHFGTEGESGPGLRSLPGLRSFHFPPREAAG
jgi:hypothetical protein